VPGVESYVFCAMPVHGIPARGGVKGSREETKVITGEGAWPVEVESPRHGRRAGGVPVHGKIYYTMDITGYKPF
jgi:hypothetical protein